MRAWVLCSSACRYQHTLSLTHRQGTPLRITNALLVYLQRCMGLVYVILILVMYGSHTHLIDALQQARGGHSADPAPCSSIHLDDKARTWTITTTLCRWMQWHTSRSC